MKFTILQEDLNKAVGVASRFTSPKAQLPVLGNVLISATKTKVKVMSTNLEISVAVTAGAKVEEEGDLSVPSKVLNDLVSNLPKETVEISSKAEQMKVSTSRFASTVLGMTSSDFPKIPTNVDKESSMTLPALKVSEALSQVSFAASLDETRPVLTGVLITKEKGGKMSLVATDGFRLSKKVIKVDGDGEFELILPKGVLTEIQRDTGVEKIDFSFNQEDKQAIFSIGDVTLSSRLLEGEYPDYEKIIPKSSSVKISVDREDFQRAVKLASVFARESSNIVKLKVLTDTIKVSAESGSSGNQETVVEAKIEKDSSVENGMEISFNYKFLEDFIHSVKNDNLLLELSGSNSAGVFRDASDGDYLHLIMPVRVQS